MKGEIQTQTQPLTEELAKGNVKWSQPQQQLLSVFAFVFVLVDVLSLLLQEQRQAHARVAAAVVADVVGRIVSVPALPRRLRSLMHAELARGRWSNALHTAARQR